MEQIHQIYDRIAKRCISLSSRCTINLINGLYGTDYSPDSEVTYNWTEGQNDDLKKTLADTIVTINHRHSYHIEFQMTKDGDIILRMFERQGLPKKRLQKFWNLINQRKLSDPMIREFSFTYLLTAHKTGAF